MAALDTILDPALTSFRQIFGTHLGNIQVLDMSGSHAMLHIAAQHGFKKPFLDAFAQVAADHETACGRALRSGKTIVISDVETDPDYAPYIQFARDAGYRAVVSTPIATRWGHNVGIISTHFAAPGPIDPALIKQAEKFAQDLAHQILTVVNAENV